MTSEKGVTDNSGLKFELIRETFEGLDPLPDSQDVMTQVLGFRTGHVRGKGWGPLPEPTRQYAGAFSSSSDGHSHQVEILRNELELVKAKHTEEMEVMKTQYDEVKSQYDEVKSQLSYLMTKFGGPEQ